MKVGDLVKLNEFLSWGVCVITKIHTQGTEDSYSVKRRDSEGITLLCNVTPKQLTVLEDSDESR